jgi:hypothetical protein
MAAPAVQSIQDLIATLGQSVDPQKQLIDQSIASNDASGVAQQAGLDAQKTTAFGQIGQQAQNNGMFFSGFTPDEQAKYTAGTYLPALANLQATIAGTRASLLGKKADLDTNIYTQAFNTNQSQQQRADAYSQAQEEAARQAAEAEKQRQFEASQTNVKIASDERIASASRAASASSAPTATQNMAEALSSKTGNDGYVSPGTYSALKSQWVAGGYGDVKSFDATFAGYRNPKNKAYKIG